jgi:hypothetical protein
MGRLIGHLSRALGDRLLHIELVTARDDFESRIEGMKPLVTSGAVEVGSRQPHRSNEGVNRTMGLTTHAQRTLTGWTLGLGLLHFSRMRVLNDGFGQAAHEVLTQLPHNGGKVG